MVIGIDASRGNLKERTGTEWYTFHVVQRLKQLVPATDRVVLYAKEPLQADWADLPPNWSVRVLRWPPKLLWTQLRLSWTMLWNPPDVLFVPAHTIPLIHPKTVLVAHDVGFERAPELYGQASIGAQSVVGNLLRWCIRLASGGRLGTSELDYHRWSMRSGLAQATHVITISEFSKREILDFYRTPESKLTTIWHGSPAHTSVPPLSATEATHLRAKFHLPPQAPVVLFVGRLERKKNLITVIDALAQIPADQRPCLVLVGKPGLGAEEINHHIAQHKLQEWVVCLGWLPNEDIAKLKRLTTALILPSWYEGFGLPILEGWAEELPVIVSNIPASQEVGGDAVASFHVDSPSDCARVLRRVTTDTAYQHQLRTAGRARLPLFSWQHTAQQTLQVIQDAAQATTTSQRP